LGATLTRLVRRRMRAAAAPAPQLRCGARCALRRTAPRSRLAPRVTRAGLFDKVMETASAANAEALARREGRDLVGKTGGVQPLQAVPCSLTQRKPDTVANVLAKMGCLGIEEVLSPATAATLLTFIVEENARSQADVLAERQPFDDRFGGVNCRGMSGPFGQRQDLFMPMDAPQVRTAVAEIVRNLSPFLRELVGGEAMLHEVSSLVAEPGSPRQCVHADTIVLPCPQYPDVSMEPLYTFFVALQDVEDDMGHTQFLPYTHTPTAHELWNAAGRSERLKERFIAAQPAVQSGLRTGDAAVFDSRVLHCGCANDSAKRRVLFYITLSAAQRWPLPDGLHGSNSVRREDRWRWRLPDLGLV
jgi:hypothetical protein